METTFENHGPSERFQIMVVDDEPESLKIIVRILSTFQCEVLSFDNVFEALHTLREQRGNFDLLLIEISLIGSKNFDMIKHLVKELDLPIITMCAYDDEKIQHELLHQGVCLHLKKPITIADLKVVSQKASEKKHEEEESNKTIISSEEKRILTKQSKSYAIRSSLDHSKREIDQAKEGSSKKNKSVCRQQGVGSSDELNKTCIEWDFDIQQRFLLATALVGEGVPPRRIHEVMGVKDLTVQKVSRHLQRYRKNSRRAKRSTEIQPLREIRPKPSFSQPIFPVLNSAPYPPMDGSGWIHPASHLGPSLGGSIGAFPNYYQMTPGQWSGTGMASTNQLSHPNFYMGMNSYNQGSTWVTSQQTIMANDPSRNQLSDGSHHAKPVWTSSTRTTPHQYIADRQASDIAKSTGPYGASSTGTNLSGLDNLTQEQPFSTANELVVPEASLDNQLLESSLADNQFNKNFGLSIGDDANLEGENDIDDVLAFLLDEPRSTADIAEGSSLAADDDDILDVGNFTFDEAAIAKMLEDVTKENDG